MLLQFAAQMQALSSLHRTRTPPDIALRFGSFNVAPISRQTRNCSLVRTSTRWSRRGAQGRSMIFFGGSPPHRPGGPWQRPHPIRSLRAGHRGQECVIPWARPPSPRCHQVATCPRLAGGAPLPAQALCCGRVPGSLVGPSRNCQAGSKTHDGTESLLPPPSTARSPAPICMVRGVQALPFLSAHIVTYSHSTTWYRCMRS